MLEGIGCIVTSILGTGSGTTSFSQNVAAIQITRVASRRVSFSFHYTCCFNQYLFWPLLTKLRYFAQSIIHNEFHHTSISI